MTRQYIGARYVIKIYENSQDALSAEWESNTNYEPLTLVTYNYGSYLSKKEVPATVGNPVDNSSYWVQTGFYNGQIASLEQAVATINSNIGNLSNLGTTDKSSIVAAINEVLATPPKRRYILIGDSFGYGIQGGGAAWVTGWLEYASAKITADGDEAIYLEDPLEAEGNMGFASSRPWLSVLQEIESTYTFDANTITDIVVIGGSNDASLSATAISSAIDTFANYIHSNYPYASLSIAPLGVNANALVNGTGTVFSTYQASAQKNGANFIPDLTLLMIDPTYYSSGGHVTEAGYNRYNPYIAHCVVNGRVEYKFNYQLAVTPDDTKVSFEAGTFPLSLFVEQTNHTIKAEVMDNTRYSPVPLMLSSKGGNTLTITDALSIPTFHSPMVGQIIAGGTIELNTSSGYTRIPIRNATMYMNDETHLSISGGFYFARTYSLLSDDAYYGVYRVNRGEAILYELG